MYRDDVCAVCGESLPPDHFYCRVHGREVDDRLHEVAGIITRVRDDAVRLAGLLREVAPETWDYVAEQQADDPLWPPAPELDVRVEPDAVDVDVDSEPGYVRVRLGLDLVALLEAVGRGLTEADVERFARVCERVTGANATH